MVYGVTFKTINDRIIIPNVNKPGFYEESDFVMGSRVIKGPKRLIIKEGILGEGDVLFSAIRKVESMNKRIPSLEHVATAYLDLGENYGPETTTLVNFGNRLLSPRPEFQDRIRLDELIKRLDKEGLILASPCPKPKSNYGLKNLVNVQFFALKHLEETAKLPNCSRESLEAFKNKLYSLWKLG